MAAPRPKVWFERSVLPDLVDEVARQATMLGPASATPDEPYAALGGAEGIVASVRRYDAAVMDRAPRLRVISRTGIGYDKVDLAAATERGIAVYNTPDGPTESTAEHAVALLLGLAKRIRHGDLVIRASGFADRGGLVGVEVLDKTLGVVGLGRIGKRVAEICGKGLGMRVIGYDPFIEGRTKRIVD